MHAARRACEAGTILSRILGGRQPGRWRAPRLQDSSDRLVEDARIFLLIVERQRTSYDGALDGLVRDAFGSADRLRSAAAAARACGRPDAEVDLLERAAGRAAPGEDGQPAGSTTSVGSTACSAGGTSPATHA